MSKTGRAIRDHISRGEISTAKLIYFNDGDKVTQYPRMREEIEKLIGCRVHGAIECSKWLCKPIEVREPI